MRARRLTLAFLVGPDGTATAAFAGLGWTWGGTWRSPKDDLHFSATGA